MARTNANADGEILSAIRAHLLEDGSALSQTPLSLILPIGTYGYA